MGSAHRINAPFVTVGTHGKWCVVTTCDTPPRHNLPKFRCDRFTLASQITKPLTGFSLFSTLWTHSSMASFRRMCGGDKRCHISLPLGTGVCLSAVWRCFHPGGEGAQTPTYCSQPPSGGLAAAQHTGTVGNWPFLGDVLPERSGHHLHKSWTAAEPMGLHCSDVSHFFKNGIEFSPFFTV